MQETKELIIKKRQSEDITVSLRSRMRQGGSLRELLQIFFNSNPWVAFIWIFLLRSTRKATNQRNFLLFSSAVLKALLQFCPVPALVHGRAETNNYLYAWRSMSPTYSNAHSCLNLHDATQSRTRSEVSLKKKKKACTSAEAKSSRKASQMKQVLAKKGQESQ